MKIKDTDFTELKEDTLDKWNREWKEEHPILNWIDEKFNQKSIADYRASYSLTHPWVILSYWGREIRYAWQRVFVGYDERVIWSIDFYLAKKIPLWMRKLKEQKQGVPSCMFTEDELKEPVLSDEVLERARGEYEKILEKIAVGFEGYLKMDEILWEDKPEYKIEKEKFEEALNLFREYFETFWD